MLLGRTSRNENGMLSVNISVSGHQMDVKSLVVREIKLILYKMNVCTHLCLIYLKYVDTCFYYNIEIHILYKCKLPKKCCIAHKCFMNCANYYLYVYPVNIAIACVKISWKRERLFILNYN